MLEILFLATGTTYFLKVILELDKVVSAIVLLLMIVIGLVMATTGLTIPRVR